MSEETALTVADQSTAVLAAFGFEEGEPVKPTRLSLIQPIQVADAPDLIAGRFRDDQSNLLYESMNIVPLLINKGRVLFPPGGELGAKPICRSKDGVVPVVADDLVVQDGGKGCAKCSKNNGRKINGKWIRSECMETISLLFAELETKFIFRLNGKGTALTPIKDFKETIRKIVLMAQAKGSFDPPYGLSFRLGAVKIRGPKGTYFIPKFTPTGRLGLVERKGFEDLYTYFTTRKDEIGDNEFVDPVADALETEQGSQLPVITQYEAA